MSRYLLGFVVTVVLPALTLVPYFWRRRQHRLLAQAIVQATLEQQEFDKAHPFLHRKKVKELMNPAPWQTARSITQRVEKKLHQARRKPPADLNQLVRIHMERAR